MAILWDSDPAAAENYHFAVGDHIAAVDAPQSGHRALGANAAELVASARPDGGRARWEARDPGLGLGAVAFGRPGRGGLRAAAGRAD